VNIGKQSNRKINERTDNGTETKNTAAHNPTLNGLVEKDVSPEKASFVSFGNEYWEEPAARAGREMGNGFDGNPTQARNPRTKRSFSGRLSSK